MAWRAAVLWTVMRWRLKILSCWAWVVLGWRVWLVTDEPGSLIDLFFLGELTELLSRVLSYVSPVRLCWLRDKCTFCADMGEGTICASWWFWPLGTEVGFKLLSLSM